MNATPPAGSTRDPLGVAISGTSMAPPHVAGAAALYLQRFPSSSPATVRSWLYNNATLNRLTGIGSDSPNRLLYTR